MARLKSLVRIFLIAFWLIGITTGTSRAETPFYHGKTVTIVVATKAGDVYDLIYVAQGAR